MVEWLSVSIGDCFDLVPGFAFKSEEFLDNGIPVIKIKNVKAGYFSDHELSYVSPDFIHSKNSKLAHFNDLLISMSGNRHDGSPETWVGKIANFRRRDNYFINQRVGALRPKHSRSIDARFAGYLLSSFPYQQLFISIATSSGGQANLSPQQILTAPFRHPDLKEQITIGETLGALDDKIELNRRMNETLEAMARAIFKDWFVDFGPTRAKMAMRGEAPSNDQMRGEDPQKQNVARAPYLAPDIWSLFPDRLDDDGKPEGWRAGKLGDVAQQVGQTVSPETLDPSTPYIGLEHMPRRSIALCDWEGAGKVTSGKLAFQKGDYLFGKLRPYFHKVGIAPLDGICSTDIVVLNARDRSAAAFVLACISQDEFVAFTDKTSDGTKMPRTSWSRMEGYGVCLPDCEALEAFNALANPMLDRIVANIHESRSLAATRDLLLPKLMSGEVRVSGAAIVKAG